MKTIFEGAVMMFRWLVLSVLLLLTACGSNTDWSASLEQQPVYVKGQPSQLAVRITDHEGQALNNLQVKATLEMVKMDHGSIEADLADRGDGVYAGNLELSMGGEWRAVLTLSDGSRTQEQTVTFQAKETKAASSQAVALINGQEISKEDMEFYTFINQLQIAMYREKDRTKYQGKELEEALKYWDGQEEVSKNSNTLLTQIIRLRAVALLAEEKGHQATEAEITKAMDDVRAIYEQSPVASELIREYGDERFWSKQKSQYQLIVLSSKVQKDVLELVKQANPGAKSNELNVLAQKKYEEILVSQMGTLKVSILQNNL
jgi:hypothetical protein